ncbi:hypothetical protein DS901_00915 [Loktanella sp. D2R18]|nr:hypothetical protein DS901_00915 [Loktanella sp. D2R18]
MQINHDWGAAKLECRQKTRQVSYAIFRYDWLGYSMNAPAFEIQRYWVDFWADSKYIARDVGPGHNGPTKLRAL